MILDSGKTKQHLRRYNMAFESVVILDSGKTTNGTKAILPLFESVVILDSGKTILDRSISGN